MQTGSQNSIASPSSKLTAPSIREKKLVFDCVLITSPPTFAKSPTVRKRPFENENNAVAGPSRIRCEDLVSPERGQRPLHTYAMARRKRLSSLAKEDPTDDSDDADGEKGVWINADPLPGCVVCNIGESEFRSHSELWGS